MGVRAFLGLLWAMALCASIGSAKVQNFPKLSSFEEGQLGTLKQLLHGEESQYGYPTQEEWPKVRRWLLGRSLQANPQLDKSLTAYTPGETLGLMRMPRIRRWHRSVARFIIPKKFDKIIFVPCAKTKPWDKAHSSKSSLYRAYHEVLERLGSEGQVYFVTLSEPLGIVPQDLWSEFPQYDNPGLFRDDAQRSGAFLSDWLASPFGKKYILPFDERAYESAIDSLSTVIAKFISQNRGPRRKFFSFVEDANSVGTHSAMLSRAVEKIEGFQIARFLKRSGPRQSPCEYILSQVNFASWQ